MNNMSQKLKLILLFAASVCVSAFSSSNASAQVIKPEDYSKEIKSPILDGDPFDLIILDDYNDNAIMKILPLAERPVQPFPEQGNLIFEFLEESETLLQVPYNRIVQYKTFNDLLIEEANAWLANKEYKKAFRNLLYVHDNGGSSDPEIVKSLPSKKSSLQFSMATRST